MSAQAPDDRELSEILGWGISTINKKVASGELPSKDRYGSRMSRHNLSEVLAWRERRREFLELGRRNQYLRSAVADMGVDVPERVQVRAIIRDLVKDEATLAPLDSSWYAVHRDQAQAAVIWRQTLEAASGRFLEALGLIEKASASAGSER